ncbi:efflux transporter, RND family, MFP subunit [Sesbania bispinosa]|nr:efflux transporter, RND family, MFP subunit [Sesbania bispinosa]
MTRVVVRPDRQRTQTGSVANGSMETELKPKATANYNVLRRDVVGEEARSNNAGMRF